MADLTTFPIPTEELDPADWPEFKGTDGTDGRTILSGEVDPTTEGEDGDFYLNTATSTLFGPKAAGTWPAGVLLKGADGTDGIDGTNGTNGVDGADGEDGAPGDAPPITTATITDGDLATELDGSIYHVALTEDVDGDWTAAIPTGGDDATTGYYCTVIFFPPGTGEGSGVGTDGPWIAPFPVGLNQVGGLDSISLAPGDDPVICQLASVGEGMILVTAVSAAEIAA